MSSNNSANVSDQDCSMNLDGTYTVKSGSGSVESDGDSVEIREVAGDEEIIIRHPDGRPISGLSVGANTESSCSPTMDLNGTYPNATEMPYQNNGYNRLKVASQQMFTRLQLTSAFLDRLISAFQGQTDSMSQKLLEQINNYKLITDVDDDFGFDEMEESSSIANIDRSVQSSMDQSITTIVTNEAAVIRIQAVELKEQLARAESQLNAANTKLLVKDETIKKLEQKIANYESEKENFRPSVIQKVADSRKSCLLDYKHQKSDEKTQCADGDSRDNYLAKLETVTEKCKNYEAYLDALVQMTSSKKTDTSAMEVPSCIDPSIHEPLITFITSAKDLEAVKRAIDGISQCATTMESNDTTENTSDADKVLARVVNSKNLADNLVNALTRLSNSPKAADVVVPPLLERSRYIFKTHSIVETYLKEHKGNVAAANYVPQIINEMTDIYAVLRDAQDQMSTMKRNRMAYKAPKK